MSRAGAISATIAVAATAMMAAGCQSGLFSSLAGGSSRDFKARDGKYFPEFVTKFFKGAEKFEQGYPSLDEARSGMRMVEVKQLNAGGGDSNESNLSWSADGAYLGFEIVTNFQRKILLKDLVGDYSRELMILPNNSANFLDGMIPRTIQSWNTGLRWSHDSSRYAFMSNGGVGLYNVYVGSVGGKERAVAKSGFKDGYATWSPRSSELAFVSARSGNGDIYVVDLSSQKTLRATKDDNVDLFPEWTPDGKSIVFASGDALNHDIMILRRRELGGAWAPAAKLTSSPRDELRPVVSPDGRWVAFYRDDGTKVEANQQRWNLHVIPLGTASPLGDAELARTIVAQDVVIDLNTGPAWTPDSRKLIFVKRDPNSFNPIHGYDLFTGTGYLFKTDTRMNRDILVSRLGILSFRAQVGVWDRVFVALTNQGLQLQRENMPESRINYLTAH